jgi:tRNA(fMet)-specific endonuclease VapC
VIRYLLDTNVLSELAYQEPDAQLAARVTRQLAACAIPAPAVDELEYGIDRLPAGAKQQSLRRWLAALISDLPVIPIDAYCALWHGRERARLTKIGRKPAFFDGLIASVAVVNELTLITRNLADFRQFHGIVLQDWHS